MTAPLYVGNTLRVNRMVEGLHNKLNADDLDSLQPSVNTVVPIATQLTKLIHIGYEASTPTSAGLNQTHTSPAQPQTNKHASHHNHMTNIEGDQAAI